MDCGTQQQSGDSLHEPGLPIKQYPLNCWWVAATVEEVGRTPLARLMLQQGIVLFRTTDGSPRALRDRCPHRWTPLSRGTLVDDEIICPYHGFRFNADGACTHVPTERRPPKALKVQSFPAIDHGPFVWLWMGDPARADPALLPSIAMPNENVDLRIADHRVLNCEYSAIHENLADSEHPRYLHGDSFANHRANYFRHKMSGVMDVSPRQITLLSRCDGMPPSNFERLLMGIPENQVIDSTMTATYTVPGCFAVEVTFKNRAAKQGSPHRAKGHYLWCSTPISSDSCHFWWVLTYDNANGFGREIAEIWGKAIQEDIDVLEAIQSTIDWSKGCDNVNEMLVGADRPVAALRRILKKAVETDVAEDSAVSTA